MTSNDQSAANAVTIIQRSIPNRRESNSFHSNAACISAPDIRYSANKLINLLEKRVLDKLFPAIKRVYLRENNYLYRPDEEINYLYILESAVISGFQMLEDGKTLETVMVGREGVTKPLTLVNSQTATDWTQVIIAGSTLRIDIKEFRKVFDDNKYFQTIFFDYLQDYYEQPEPGHEYLKWVFPKRQAGQLFLHDRYCRLQAMSFLQP